jgi:hypothetical protein
MSMGNISNGTKYTSWPVDFLLEIEGVQTDTERERQKMDQLTAWTFSHNLKSKAEVP